MVAKKTLISYCPRSRLVGILFLAVLCVLPAFANIPRLSETPLQSLASTNAPHSTISQNSDPQVEFLEIGVSFNGNRTWKIHGPDLNGRYGGLMGMGGLEGTVPGVGGTRTALVSDFFGNVVATLKNTSVKWAVTPMVAYGPVPGFTPPQFSSYQSLAEVTLYRGKRIDPTGFYWMGARYYEPKAGRFLSADPLGHGASWNLYSYANGDPINRFDPDGRCGQSADGQFGSSWGDGSFGQNPGYESLIDDLYSPKVSLDGIVNGLVNIGFGVATAPFSFADSIGNSLTTAIGGTYEDEYGVTVNASTGRRLWEGAMAAMAVIPVGDAFEAGYQGLRGISAGFGRAAAVGDRIGGFAEFLAAKGVDFMAAGRLGGGLYDAGKLGQLEGYLGRRGVTLQVGDEFLPAGKVGGFNAAEGTLSLRSNPTQYEVWHELSHFRQFQQLGPEAYMSQSLVQKEQFVFDLLNNSPRRWDALNFDQQQHAIQYILEKGGMR